MDNNRFTPVRSTEPHVIHSIHSTQPHFTQGSK